MSKALIVNFKADTVLIKQLNDEFVQCATLDAKKDIRELVRITNMSIIGEKSR